MPASLPRLKTRNWWAELGDRLCCTALVLTGLVGVACLAWYVWQMPAPL